MVAVAAVMALAAPLIAAMPALLTVVVVGGVLGGGLTALSEIENGQQLSLKSILIGAAAGVVGGLAFAVAAPLMAGAAGAIGLSGTAAGLFTMGGAGAISSVAGTLLTYALDPQARQQGWSGLLQSAGLGLAGGVIAYGVGARVRSDAPGCNGCFVAGTLVATPHGARAMQMLHVGDLVQAQSLRKHKKEVERVERVIHDPRSPLVAVDLSDGSTITTTARHAFWVVAGIDIAPSGAWVWATHLRYGDHLRAATGHDIQVVRVRQNVGYADVWTLTVAIDHTFFVGSAQILVHNCDVPRYEDSPKHHANAGPGVSDAPVDGQAALDNSVQVKGTSPRRVGVDPDTNEIVVLDETHPGQQVYHGHVRTWDELTPQMKNALKRAGLVDGKGQSIRK